MASLGRLKGNLIEGMACKCVCIRGASSISHGPKDVTEVDTYGKLSKEQNSVDATRVFDLENIDLERKYSILNDNKSE